jgi:hypothetical protein
VLVAVAERVAVGVAVVVRVALAVRVAVVVPVTLAVGVGPMPWRIGRTANKPLSMPPISTVPLAKKG